MSKPAADQERQLKEAFARFDSNGDGKIQADEFKRLMTSLGEFNSKEIKRLFKEADSDGSGGVDWREFLEWICSGTALKGMGAQAAASFERLLYNETMDEASFVEQAAIGAKVTDYVSKKEVQKKQRSRRKSTAKGTLDELGVPVDFKGHMIQIPMTNEGAVDLMRHYLNNGHKRGIHAKHATYLIEQFIEKYSERHPKPVVHTDCPADPTGRLIVVGDTHGQLADVLHIFYHLGPPTATNRYLFNGDMVDRGPMGVEILLMLFSYFVADPESIIIHRGNHENEDMNALDIDSGGGFADEVMKKYGLSVYRCFISAFKCLSLCSVINKEIFVVHGGLTRVKSLLLDFLDNIPHTECTTPPPMSSDVKDQIFSDLVWSDPTEAEGKFKSDRGVGIKFGPDVTTKFCSQNRLRFIVRSHQVPEDGRGFGKQHNDRCVTVFSASNYCGDGGNYGAVLVLSSATFPRYEVFEHYAASLPEMAQAVQNSGVEMDWAQYSTDQQKGTAEDARKLRHDKSLVRMIISIIDKKPQLWASLIDQGLGRQLDVEVWAKFMSSHIEGGHPWIEAADSWGVVGSDGKLEMSKFLGRWVVNIEYKGYSSFVNSAIKHVYEAIMKMDMDLAKTFQLFDKDGDGTVDLKEAKQVLNQFDLGLSSKQVDRLVGQLFNVTVVNDASSEMRMNVQEFLGHFALVYSATNQADLPKWVQECLKGIGRLIFAGGDSGNGNSQVGHDVAAMTNLFKKIDTSGDGTLQLEEFVEGIEQLPGIKTLGVDGAVLTHERLMDMAKAMDITGDGSINYMEFLQAFQRQTDGNSDLQNSLVEDVNTVLFRHRASIRKGCQYLDDVDSGKVLKEEFILVLQGVNSALSSSEQSLTEMLIEHLASALAVEEEDGLLVGYEAFLQSFVVVDTADGSVVKSFALNAEE